jgi:hypothetical protein
MSILRKLKSRVTSPRCFRYDCNSSSAASSDVWLPENTYPTPRRVVRPMSHIQPADCAVEIVAEPIAASSLGYGTCTAQALSMNNTSLLERNGTSKCLPISSEENPLQSSAKFLHRRRWAADEATR